VAAVRKEDRNNSLCEELKGIYEEEILNNGYTYRDIEDVREAIIAVNSEIEEEARKNLSRFRKNKLASLFYLVGKLDGGLEGFQRAIHLTNLYEEVAGHEV
jgi:hypothetical protein